MMSHKNKECYSAEATDPTSKTYTCASNKNTQSPNYHGILVPYAIVLLIAGLTRFYASLGDFWLDEIWTYNFVFSDRIQTPIDILTNGHHHINHYLNSWFFYLFGPHMHWVAYRFPSVLAGIGTVVLAGVIGQRHSTREGFSAMVLTAGSYMLVHYSSEARGYSAVIFFALLSFYLLERAFLFHRKQTYFLFAISSILGFLSHLEFIFCFTGFLSWAAWSFYKNKPNRHQYLQLNLYCFVPPILFVGWLYYVDISRMIAGGANILPLDAVLLQLFSLVLGGPLSGSLAYITTTFVLIGILSGIVLLWKKGRDEWLFHIITIFAAPVIICALSQEKFLYPRHFLVCWIFGLLLLNHVITQSLRLNSYRRRLHSLLVIAIIASNVPKISRLISVGRGQYQTAIRMINQKTTVPVISIGSDHSFRNSALLNFYINRNPNLKPIIHVPIRDSRIPSTEWFIIHDFGPEDHPPLTNLRNYIESHYKLTGVFPYSGLSGWRWLVYRNKNHEHQFIKKPKPFANRLVTPPNVQATDSGSRKTY